MLLKNEIKVAIPFFNPGQASSPLNSMGKFIKFTFIIVLFWPHLPALLPSSIIHASFMSMHLNTNSKYITHSALYDK
jgi:hypothetical protein